MQQGRELTPPGSGKFTLGRGGWWLAQDRRAEPEPRVAGSCKGPGRRRPSPVLGTGSRMAETCPPSSKGPGSETWCFYPKPLCREQILAQHWVIIGVFVAIYPNRTRRMGSTVVCMELSSQRHSLTPTPPGLDEYLQQRAVGLLCTLFFNLQMLSHATPGNCLPAPHSRAVWATMPTSNRTGRGARGLSTGSAGQELKSSPPPSTRRNLQGTRLICT